MQIVAADVGNSSIKYNVGNLSRPLQQKSGTRLAEWPECRSVSLMELSSDNLEIVCAEADWFVSSVNETNLQRFRNRVQESSLVNSWHVVDRNEVPLYIDLEQPEQVGIDRLLAALAAHRLSGSNRDTVVIDCGTAMTIDLVDKESNFRGGVIIAGPATNLLALQSMTEALPDLSQEPLTQPANVLGRSTRQAMLNGAWFNGLGAIREVVSAIEKALPEKPVVVGTGGGLGPWQDVLPDDWVLVNDLVLEGIFHVAIELNRGLRQ